MSAHGGGSRRRREVHEEGHESSERWAVSYGDMLTVLLALFIVLYAISQVDQQKFVALRDSLAAGFNDGSTQTSVLDGTTGTMDGLTVSTDKSVSSSTASLVSADQGLGSEAANPTPVPSPSPSSDVAAAQAELTRLDQLKAQMSAALAKQGVADEVTFRITDHGLVVGMVANDVFFAAQSAELTPAADKVVDALAPTLRDSGRDISVEGHANVLPTSGSRYETNWELSADRATKVVRRLVEADGMIATKIEAVGFGDTRPLKPGTDPASLAANRRVDIVVESDAPDSVRALLPTLAGS